MKLKAFEQCVEQALKDIPQEFRDMMENITIEVELDRKKSMKRLKIARLSIT